MQWLRLLGSSRLLAGATPRSLTACTGAQTVELSQAPAAQTALGGLWDRLRALAPEVSESLWTAVPKRKVTPHRKGKRAATKYIRYVPVVSQCSKCERIFQQHSLPRKCEQEECPAFTLRARPQ